MELLIHSGQVLEAVTTRSTKNMLLILISITYILIGASSICGFFTSHGTEVVSRFVFAAINPVTRLVIIMGKSSRCTYVVLHNLCCGGDLLSKKKFG